MTAVDVNPAWIIENPTVTIGAGPITVTCELTRAAITNAVNMVDTGSLCGPAQQPGKIEYTLELEGYQAFGDTPQALWDYLWENARQQVPFTLVPRNDVVSATNPEFSGTCVCVPGQVGGTMEEAATFVVALPIVGVPLKSDTGTTTTMREAREAPAREVVDA